MNILIVQQRNWSVKFGTYLAKKLKNKGHNIGSITIKKSTHNYVIDNGFIDNIWSHDEIIENPKKYLDKCKLNLNEISDYLNINSVWEIIQSQRLLVKDYNRKYYYSFKKAVNDEYLVNYIKSCFGMIEEIFDKFKPSIVVSPVLNSFLHSMLFHYCEKKKIPIFGTTDSKVDNINIFTNSYLDDKSDFKDYLIKIRSGEIKLNYENLIEEEKYLKFKISQLKSIERIDLDQNISISYLLSELKLFARSFNFKKNLLGSTQDLVSPSIFLRNFYYKHYYKYKSKKFKYNNLELIENFAFMPLLLQPEENIDLISTRFNNQIETARQVAMSLPADMTLVVKNHPSMDEKTSNTYLEKIKFLPNVKLIDCRIPNWKIFKKCKIVIATSGTSVFEASVLNIPVIQLGNLGTIRMLPNVHFHNNLSNLKEKIKDILKIKINEKDSHERMIEYIHAAFKKGIKYNMWDDLILKKPEVKEELFNCYYSEIERLTNNFKD